MAAARDSFYISRVKYYTVQTLAFGGLISCYGMRAWTARYDCKEITNPSIDTTEVMTRTFQICFFVHVVQFLQCSLFGPYFDILLPIKMAKSEEASSRNAPAESCMQSLLMALEYIFRCLVIVLALFQLALQSRDDLDKCIENQEIIKTD